MAVRQDKKRATRHALKEAALACIGRSGWETTSVGSISREAGVAHGTFYVHFPTKEALLDELLVDFNGDLAARLESAWRSGDGSLETRVRATAQAFLDQWHLRKDFVRAYAQRLGGASLETLRDGVNPPAERLVRSRIEEWLGAPGGASTRALLVAQGLLALWLRVGLQALFNPAVSKEEAVTALTQMTLGIVSTIPPTDTAARR